MSVVDVAEIGKIGESTFGDMSIGLDGLAAVPNQLLEVAYNDTVRVSLSIEYRGPAISGAIRVAIGVKGLWFDEIFIKDIAASFPESSGFVTYPVTADILIDRDRPGMYDMYAKTMSMPGAVEAFTDFYLKIIELVAEVPGAEFRNFAIDEYVKL